MLNLHLNLLLDQQQHLLGRENYRWNENLEPKTALFTITSIAKQYLMNKNNFRAYLHQQAPLALPPFLLQAAQQINP